MATQNSVNIGITSGGGNQYTFPSGSDTLVGQLTIDTYQRGIAPISVVIPAGYCASISNQYQIYDGISLTIEDTGILLID